MLDQVRQCFAKGLDVRCLIVLRQRRLAQPALEEYKPAWLLDIAMQVVLERSWLLERRRHYALQDFLQLVFVARLGDKSCNHSDFRHDLTPD